MPPSHPSRLRRLLIPALAIAAAVAGLYLWLGTGEVAAPATGAAATSAPPSTPGRAAPSGEPGVTSGASDGTPEPAPATASPWTEPSEVATDPPVATGGPSVDVVVTVATWDEATATAQAAGYVSGVIEDGGTCTLVLSRDVSTVEVSAPGVADASTTSCGGLSTATGQALAPGEWQAVLRYDSPRAQGTSEPVTVTVP